MWCLPTQIPLYCTKTVQNCAKKKKNQSYHRPDPFLRRLAVDGWLVILLNGSHQPGLGQFGSPQDREHLSVHTVTILYCEGMLLWNYLLISCEMLTDHCLDLFPITILLLGGVSSRGERHLCKHTDWSVRWKVKIHWIMKKKMSQ